MDFQIENEQLRAGFKQKGAEWCSLQVKGHDRERIWQADPKLWGRHAPLLFPVVGTLREQQLHHRGNSYPMPRHGFLRDRNCELRWQKEDAICFALNSDEESAKHYPFDFLIEIEYRLVGPRVEHHFRVHNPGAEDLIFCLGGHPAFRIPFNEEEDLWDYQIHLEVDDRPERSLLDKNGLYTGEKESVFHQGSSLDIGPETFSKDALVFKQLGSRKIRLQHRSGGPFIEVDRGDFRHLGLWAKAGAPFVCIEPWIGHSDSTEGPREFSQKADALTLPPGEDFQAQFSVTFAEN